MFRTQTIVSKAFEPEFLRKTADFIRKRDTRSATSIRTSSRSGRSWLPYFPEMQAKIAEVLGIPANNVHVKAKTMNI